MNSSIKNNFARLKPSLFFLPLFLLIAIILFLYSQGALNVYTYIKIQKESFLFINYYLGQYPSIEYNLTQIGDASIFLSFLSIYIIYAPKMWESLISASLVSFILSSVLKNLFSVPRPAQVFDTNSFVIVGKTISGFTSLPSGHSITVFTIFTVLLFAFIPQKLRYKILWIFSIITLGLIIAFSRVGVGAHYPLDVIIGSIVGYLSALIGIFFNQKYTLWNWINIKKYYPVFIVLFLICIASLVYKIMNENLIVFYFALISLFFSLYKIIYVYAKK